MKAASTESFVVESGSGPALPLELLQTPGDSLSLKTKSNYGWFGASLIVAMLCVVCAASGVSAGWLLVACMTLLLLGQSCCLLPGETCRILLGALAVASALMAVNCTAAFVMAPSLSVGSDLVGSAIVACGAGLQAAKPLNRTRPGTCCGSVGCGSSVCSWIAAAMLALSAIIVCVDAVWGMWGLVAYGPQSVVRVIGGPRINYWCEGSVQGNAIILLEPGYMGPAPMMYWFLQGLAPITRTCLYDQAGVGWSSEQSTYSFRDDARNMKAVIDAEFEIAAVPAEQRIAVVGGHSRGFVSASTFKQVYDDLYRRVLVIGLDGARCESHDGSIFSSFIPGPEWIWQYVAIFTGPLRGGGRLALLLFPDLRHRGVDGDFAGFRSEDAVYLPPVREQWAFCERMLGLTNGGWFRSAIGRGHGWVGGSYDGPDGCPRSGNVTYVVAGETCVGSPPSCASHTSLVAQSRFAEPAIASITAFLDLQLSGV